MADYRYLVDADINWNQNKYFQEIASFLQNCAKDLGMTIYNVGDVGGLIREAYKLVAPLELFGFCPYYIESMKRDYVWPCETESDAEAYNYRVLVFATAYFLMGRSIKNRMRSYYKAFVSKQGGYVDQFKAWEAAAEKLHFNYAFEKKKHLIDINWSDFHRNPWDKITDDFNSEVMVKILDQYKTLEKKKRVLDCMEAFCLIRPQFAYMLDAERPGSIAKFREWIDLLTETNKNSELLAIVQYCKESIYGPDFIILNAKNYDELATHKDFHFEFHKEIRKAIRVNFNMDPEDSLEVKIMRDTLTMSIMTWYYIKRQNVLLGKKLDDIFVEKEINRVEKEYVSSGDGLVVYGYLYYMLINKYETETEEWEKELLKKIRDYYQSYYGFDIEKEFHPWEYFHQDDFMANVIELNNLYGKNWVFATQGFEKLSMLRFISAGRTQVEQWKIAEALEKSYAKLVDSDEMYKIKNFNALVDLDNFKNEILQGTYLVGAKPIDSEEMNKRLKRKDYEEMEKEVEELKAENERLKASPLQTGVKWTGNKIDLLRIIDVLWEMNKIKYDGPEGGNSKKIVFEKLGPAFGKDLSGGTKTISDNESGMNSDNPPALSIFEAMLTKKRDLIDEKDVKK